MEISNAHYAIFHCLIDQVKICPGWISVNSLTYSRVSLHPFIQLLRHQHIVTGLLSLNTGATGQIMAFPGMEKIGSIQVCQHKKICLLNLTN